MKMDSSVVLGRWSLVVGKVVLALSLSAATVCGAEPPSDAAEAKEPPARSIKFVLDDQPLVVVLDGQHFLPKIGSDADELRYAAVVRGFASFLVGDVDNPRNSTLDTIQMNELERLTLVLESPANRRIQRFIRARRSDQSYFFAFRGRGVDDYDAAAIKPPPGKHVSFSQPVGNNGYAFLHAPNIQSMNFAPAREVEQQLLQEYVFLAQSVEEAQGLARDFLDLYDHGLLGRLRKLAEDAKVQFTASRDKAAPRLPELEKRVAEETKQLEGVEPLGDVAISDLKVKRTLLKVDLAGVKARLEAIDKRLDGEPAPDRSIQTRLSELKVTAEIDLASLAAQQQVLGELIDGQQQLRELSKLRDGQLKPVKDVVHNADSGIERCDEILADLLPFQLVNETVVIRRVKFSLPGATPAAK